MPKGYWVAHVDVRNPELYQQYVKANAAAFAKYGARFLVRGGKHVVTRGKSAGAQCRHRISRLRDCARLPRFRGISRSRQVARRRKRC